MTQDIDIVIDPTISTLPNLIKNLPQDAYYADEAAAHDALLRRSMFNVMDLQTGWKIDFIIRKARPFSIVEFQRRKPARLFDVNTFIAAPEDVILAKLEWSSLSGSDRQLADVAGMFLAKYNELDTEYLEKWAIELGVLHLWHKVQRASAT